jgi:hypothetical protein
MRCFKNKSEVQNEIQKHSTRNSSHQTKESKNLNNDVKRMKGNLQSLHVQKEIENHKNRIFCVRAFYNVMITNTMIRNLLK